MMKTFLALAFVVTMLTPAAAQSWGRGGGYVGASRGQGYYPRQGVHRCTWSISDRKSTRLNSSHQIISYAVFCLKKKKKHVASVKHNHLANVDVIHIAVDRTTIV